MFLLLVAVLLWLFAEPVAKDTTEEVSTELLGTQVDVGKLDIIADEASVDLRELQIADPFDVNRNLVEAAEIRLKLNPLALAEKKFVVENFRLSGMRFGTDRKEPAKPVESGGFAPQAMKAVRQWSEQFDVPLLKLTPIDTIKAAGPQSDPAHLGAGRPGRSRAGRLGEGAGWSARSSSSTSRARWTPPARWSSGSGPPTPASSASTARARHWKTASGPSIGWRTRRSGSPTSSSR